MNENHRQSRLINKTVREGIRHNSQVNVYISRGIYSTYNAEQPARIIQARVKDNQLQVKLLSTGKWIDCSKDFDLILIR